MRQFRFFVWVAFGSTAAAACGSSASSPSNGAAGASAGGGAGRAQGGNGATAGSGGRANTGGRSGAGEKGGKAGSGPIDGTAGAEGGAAGAAGGAVGTEGGAAGAAAGAAGEHPAGAAGEGGAPDVVCNFDVSASVSKAIPTVGIVTFPSDASLDGGRIEFGSTRSYGMTAPLDLAAASYRTLLLGMKQDHDYHYRVVAEQGGTECATTDATLHTGVLSSLPTSSVTTKDASKLAGGFLVGEWYDGGEQAFIRDADLDIVWAFDPQISDLTRARMSNDGQWMWIAHGNVPSQTAHMVRVSMDGLTIEDRSSEFVGMNQDFLILPDETIYFLAWGTVSPKIVQYVPGGPNLDLIDLGTVFSPGSLNAAGLEYSAEDDTLVVSEVSNHALVKLTRAGDVVWVLGGPASSFTGYTPDSAQFNFQMLGKDDILAFHNGATGTSSSAVELVLDTTQMTATKVWEYQPTPDIDNAIFGDVQRLSNGNTLVVFSTQGVIQEIGPDKSLLRQLSGGTGQAMGYVTERATLYGPPPF